jgi:probable biosynthetic protein (TIGR04099 family)
MPHLSVVGLSETWLLKEAGHVHWQLLEEAVGCRSRHWKDGDGSRLYASFIAYRFDGLLAAALGEGDLLECLSELGATSRNRFCSRHVLRCANLPFEATLWMVTTFVRRDGNGESNRGFVRTSFGSSERVDELFGDTVDQLLGRRRQFRREAAHLLDSSPSISSFSACPMEDFNHAGMIYFAAFPRYLDRAEVLTQTALPSLSLPPLVSRSCFYYGNADAGDEIEAVAVRQGDAAVSQIWSRKNLLCAAETVRITS